MMSVAGAFPLARALVLACFLALSSAGLTAGAAPGVPPGARLVDLPPALTKPAPENLQDLRAIQNQVKKVLEKVIPCTVGLRVGGASGSGVIVSADGHVLTAGHVSGEPGRSVTIILHDGRMVKGKTLGVNKGIDSGLIKITDKGKWPFVDMGASDKLVKGQWCIATGHPGGYKKGRSPVVRVGRVVLANASVVRTDCALVGGDSGGPLFDMTGKVIGIHSRIGMSIADNVHVPVDTYRSTWDRLVASESWGGRLFGGGGRPDAAYLGVRRDAEATDCRVGGLVPGAPAEKAGLKAGDVIVKFGGEKVADFDALTALVQKKKADDEVVIEVKRGEETKTFKVKLARAPSR
jgi:serine protease Do